MFRTGYHQQYVQMLSVCIENAVGYECNEEWNGKIIGIDDLYYEIKKGKMK